MFSFPELSTFGSTFGRLLIQDKGFCVLPYGRVRTHFVYVKPPTCIGGSANNMNLLKTLSAPKHYQPNPKPNHPQTNRKHRHHRHTTNHRRKAPKPPSKPAQANLFVVLFFLIIFQSFDTPVFVINTSSAPKHYHSNPKRNKSHPKRKHRHNRHPPKNRRK